MKGQKMIRTQDALEARLRSGSRLRETRVHEPEDRSIWCIAETGETVHGQAVNLCRGRGLLRPLADGLFGEAQTYELAS
jgi:hypothetical protein